MRLRAAVWNVLGVLGAVTVLFTLCSPATAAAQEGPPRAPVNELRTDSIVENWLLLGPFPNPEPLDRSDQEMYRIGYATDYLTALGGESDAKLSDETTVTFRMPETGEEQQAEPSRVRANGSGIVDIGEAYGSGKQAAYAFCYIRSAAAQQVQCYVGTDDSAKIWVNGVKVLDVWEQGGRACRRGENTFSFAAREGLNSVLVKVENSRGNWQFILEACDEAGQAAREARGAHKAAIRAFQAAELVPAHGGFVRPPGPLPAILWKDPGVVTPVLGEPALSVEWYRIRAHGQRIGVHKVTKTMRPGQYAAVVEAVAGNGMTVRRKLSFLCVPEHWRPPVAKLRAYAEAMPMYPAYEYDLSARVDAIALHPYLPEDGFGTELDAMLIAVAENASTSAWPLDISDRFGVALGDVQFALRAKLEGRKVTTRLELPRRVHGGSAPVLHTGTPEAAGMDAATPERLRAICNEWYDASREPFAVLVARHGVVVFHEAFGDTAVNTPMWVASISKLITAVLFAQFVDQGLLELDEPVGNYLIDFPTFGEKVVTLRECFTHTTGFEGHNEWNGIYNQYIDNVLANGLEIASPGTLYLYNGMGHNLAGKVMEIAGGKSILRMMYENFFEPLGMTNTTVGNLGSGCCSTPADMARLGQLLLNRGTYGELEFFSPETFERMLPVDLSKFYPNVDAEFGLSIGWMRQRVEGAGEKKDVPHDATILSRHVIGHGAASGAIFRVDLENNLVIVQTRNESGRNYSEYARRFIETIDECLAPSAGQNHPQSIASADETRDHPGAE